MPDEPEPGPDLERMISLSVVPVLISGLEGSLLDELKNRNRLSGETKAELALSPGALISGPNLVKVLHPPSGILKLI